MIHVEEAQKTHHRFKIKYRRRKKQQQQQQRDSEIYKTQRRRLSHRHSTQKTTLMVMHHFFSLSLPFFFLLLLCLRPFFSPPFNCTLQCVFIVVVVVFSFVFYCFPSYLVLYYTCTILFHCCCFLFSHWSVLCWFVKWFKKPHQNSFMYMVLTRKFHSNVATSTWTEMKTTTTLRKKTLNRKDDEMW